jgi:hypothetical protein
MLFMDPDVHIQKLEIEHSMGPTPLVQAAQGGEHGHSGRGEEEEGDRHHTRRLGQLEEKGTQS